MKVFLVIDELPMSPTLIMGIFDSFEKAVEESDKYVDREIQWFKDNNPYANIDLGFDLSVMVDKTECLRDYVLPTEKKVGFLRKIYSMTGYRTIKILEIEVE